MSPSIRPLVQADLPLFESHFRRHRAESGRDGMHFMPYEPDDPEGPAGLNADALALPLTERGWQRWWIAVEEGGEVIGHVDLKGSGLKAGLHRCEVGIGIEAPFRRGGLGRRLMQAAIDFCRAAESISWIDLGVFAHNSAARALYESLGFSEIGTITDRFRLGGQSVDDVSMTLRVD